MINMSTSESNTYLAHLIAEMLAMPNLPADLRQALSEHLNKQLSTVNILKPEFCRRLYPILAELAELNTYPEISAPVARTEIPATLGITDGRSSDSLYDKYEKSEDADL
ncbi:MAG TPA: hypothetical protein VJ302_10890 [Blastocatellia bacterium]|nr:hypothetical protein [Blastocatellia bacterium]